MAAVVETCARAAAAESLAVAAAGAEKGAGQGRRGGDGLGAVQRLRGQMQEATCAELALHVVHSAVHRRQVRARLLGD
eukprot:COSAG01_NODE_476_length_16515_cov_37.730690_12_plen_78_part_00